MYHVKNNENLDRLPSIFREKNRTCKITKHSLAIEIFRWEMTSTLNLLVDVDRYLRIVPEAGALKLCKQPWLQIFKTPSTRIPRTITTKHTLNKDFVSILNLYWTNFETLNNWDFEKKRIIFWVLDQFGFNSFWSYNSFRLQQCYPRESQSRTSILYSTYKLIMYEFSIEVNCYSTSRKMSSCDWADFLKIKKDQ